MNTIPVAAILAGGTSRRFGSDKTLALFHDKPLVSYVREGAGRYASEVIVVSKDIGKYAFLGIRQAVDKYDTQCLLVGIITALENISGDFVFVIAADMPFFPFHVLPDMALQTEGFDAVIPLIDSRPYPCAAIYKKSAVNILTDFFKTGDYKMLHTLAKLNVKYIDEDFFSKHCNTRRAFMNVNTKEDFENLLST
jgi:molybdopterin-guanine dinucleotide biosynthesis protein A